MLISFTSRVAKSSISWARSASKARISGISEVRARRRKLRAMLRGSCRAMPMNTPAKAYFCCLVRRPTIPKSISTSVPSGRTSTLPGWGSAWKDAELENLGQVDVHAGFGHLLRAQAPLQQLRLVGDFAAAHELNHQDAGGAQLAVGLRDIERVVVCVQRAELLHAAGLGGVVQLLGHAALEGVHDVLRVAQALLAQEAGRQAHQLVEQAQVGAHLFLHVGPLHLHHHLLAREQPRPVHLPDAGRAQRHVLKLGEHLLQRPAQLPLDNLARLGHGETAARCSAASQTRRSAAWGSRSARLLRAWASLMKVGPSSSIIMRIRSQRVVSNTACSPSCHERRRLWGTSRRSGVLVTTSSKP